MLFEYLKEIGHIMKDYKNIKQMKFSNQNYWWSLKIQIKNAIPNWKEFKSKTFTKETR